MPTTIALINSTPAAIPPARAAVLDAVPNARVWNILDDRLQDDADEHGGVDEAMRDRMRRLIAHAEQGGAEAILLTCSIYADVAHEQASAIRVPVLAADDGALDEVLDGAFERILVVASLQSPLSDVSGQLRRRADQRNQMPIIDGVVPEGAYEAAASGDATLLAESIATAIRTLDDPPQVLLLAQFSLAPARTELESLLGIPVVAGPTSAASAVASALRSGA